MLVDLIARVDEAVDLASLYGLLKKSPRGGLIHAPFALSPCPIDSVSCQRLEALSLPFNRLARAVSGNLDFLEEALGEVAATDPFTADLLRLARASQASQPLYLQITRSDYFLQAGEDEGLPRVRQVELNTISASYPALAARVNLLHRQLLADTAWETTLVPNDPLPGLVLGFSEAFRLYGHGEACVLMVVQADEANVFDQRLLEIALRAERLPVLRLTLEAVAEQGSLREGHLMLDGRICAITYFRAGYTPDDFRAPEALRGRELIENSSTIPVPGLATHLAGTKKVQQLLTRGETLRLFCEEQDARAMEETFAGIYALEEPVEADGGSLPAHRAAAEAPHRFVLKPQREGGGNNLYDDEMTARLSGLAPEEQKAYVLMERIRPIPHHAVVVVEGQASEGQYVSEIGRFGVLLADGKEILLNRDTGYLVRTKHHQVREGGVSAGFAHLNSLVALPPGEAYKPL